MKKRILIFISLFALSIFGSVFANELQIYGGKKSTENIESGFNHKGDTLPPPPPPVNLVSINIGK